MRKTAQARPGLGVINSSVDELNLVHTSTYILSSSSYQYILVRTCPNNLGSDEVANQERECQHQHFHAITSHFSIFLAINVDVVEVGSVFGGQGDHGRVCYHSFQLARQSFPHTLNASSGNEWLSSAVDKLGTQQYLCISVQHHRHNVVTKEPQIPAEYS